MRICCSVKDLVAPSAYVLKYFHVLPCSHRNGKPDAASCQSSAQGHCRSRPLPFPCSAEALELAYVRKNALQTYIVPPRKKWAALSAVLMRTPLSSPDHDLGPNNICSASSRRKMDPALNAKPFVASGNDLHRALIVAHSDKHYASLTTWRILGESFFPLSLCFV